MLKELTEFILVGCQAFTLFYSTAELVYFSGILCFTYNVEKASAVAVRLAVHDSLTCIIKVY